MSEAQAAYELYHCLLRLGEKQSNPALEVLAGADRLEPGRHYPEPYLQFEGHGLRAYLHSHEHPGRQDQEQGHFHLFVQWGHKDWAHLGAVSIDAQGQPRRWLTTNRWVTDESWQSAAQLKSLELPTIDTSTLSLAETWLYAMLRLYRRELYSLWELRDQKLRSMEEGNIADSLENRNYYILSAMDIDLLAKLQSQLAETETETV
ncbi:MAG: hypothetical protein HUJ29_01990 [Gammaproteobacteria bacterium]|nr:hypothetical protein [Gammaproteobacteria bacterium]